MVLATLLLTVLNWNTTAATLSGFERAIGGIIYPRDSKDIKAVVDAANRHGVSLYPISAGKNWGFGSRLPVTERAFILDLHRHMNRILKLDSEFGYAVIEPGVTQAQLSDRLARENSRFFVDVTGSGGATSLVGNTLDRGVGFNAVRAEDMVSMEVVLGNGDVLRTGFGHYPDSKLAHLYPYGIGPDINGLFLQSSLGIVTQLTLRLRRRPPAHQMFIAFLNHDSEIGAMAEALRDLKQAGALPSVVHLFNRARLNLANEKTLSARYLASKAWAAVGSVTAPSAGGLSHTRRIVARSLGQFGRVEFFGYRKLAALRGLARFTRHQGVVSVVETLTSLHGLTIGIPTNMAIEKLCSLIGSSEHGGEPDLDHSGTGMMFCCPMVPARVENVNRIVGIVETIGQREGLRIPHTFMMTTANCLANVLMLLYDRADPTQRDLCHRVTKEIYQLCCQEGFTPYRIDIDNMAALREKGDVYWATVVALRRALDPNGIIAPGRYLTD